jgi:hypothetical protein
MSKPFKLFGRSAIALLSVGLLESLMLQVTSVAASDPRHQKDRDVSLVPGAPGASLTSSTTLSTALPIINDGIRTARNVLVTSITLSGGALSSPTAFPVALGSIAPGGASPTIYASFAGASFVPGGQYLLVVKGTYMIEDKDADRDKDKDKDTDRDKDKDKDADRDKDRDKDKDKDKDRGRDKDTVGFAVNQFVTIPPAAPGSAPVKTTSAPPNFVSGGGFVTQPPNFSNDDKENGPGWTVPLGPFVPVIPTPSSTTPQKAPDVTKSSINNASPSASPSGDPAVQFFANGTVSGFANGSFPAEPSGATGGGVVFLTLNSFAAYSTDNGNTFTGLNPTNIFPNTADGGFCCDQIVQYVPSIDRFIWLMQFNNQTDAMGNRLTGNRLRIASASPAGIINSGGTAWTYWDLTTGQFGLGTNQLDYPDLSVGNNFLYVSADNRFAPSGQAGLVVMRIPLNQIQAGITINIGYTAPSDSQVAYGSHLLQNTGDEIFWAGNYNNSVLRVFSLQEASNTYSWRDTKIGTFSTTGLSSTTPSPNGQDWLTFGAGFPGNGVLGATRQFQAGGGFSPHVNNLWFAWTAGTDANFPQPHVEMVVLDRDNNFSLVQQVQIWNSGFAFAYPALATNFNPNSRLPEIGLSLETGGGGNFENHAVGFWGDFLVYLTTSSDTGTTRYGDYVTIRQNSPDPSLFAAFGYGANTVPPPGSGFRADVHYILFGRPSPTPPPPPK